MAPSAAEMEVVFFLIWERLMASKLAAALLANSVTGCSILPSLLSAPKELISIPVFLFSRRLGGGAVGSSEDAEAA